MAVRLSGSATLRVGTQDRKTWQLYEADGETEVSLETATRVVLRLRNDATGAISEYATDDATPILFVLVPASDGKVQLRPTATTFTAAGIWRFHFIVTDAQGAHPVPEDRDEVITVIDSYPPS